ncbi:MAG: fibronectin type III domain-containing protein, partial [Proteobacteria bacterium]|nr:fibronectin type III domain-containing protein [Pseudomonadota bacterium]
VWRHTTDDNSAATKLGDSTAITVTTFADSGLAASTQYHYWLKACNTAGCSAFGSDADKTTDAPTTTVEIPAAPGAPTLTVGSDTAISLSWAVTAEADDYEVYRHTADNSSMATKISGVTNIAATTYDDTGLTAATTYHYWLKACNGTGCSANFSAPLTVTTAPAPAAGLTAMANNAGDTVTLAWTAATAAIRYEVFRNTTGDAATATEVGGGSDIILLTYNDTTTRDTTYYYWVLSCDANNCSSPRTSVSVITTLVLVAPATPTVSDVLDISLTLNWLAVDTATRYEVWRHTADDSSAASKLDADDDDTDLSYADSGLVAGTRYYYWVKTCLDDMCSDFSSPVDVIIPPTRPENLMLTADSISQISLVWGMSSAAGVVYELDRAQKLGSLAGPYQNIRNDLTGTTFTDTGLSGGITYFYRVRACLGSGNNRICSNNFVNFVTTFDNPPILMNLGSVTLTVGEEYVKSGRTGDQIETEIKFENTSDGELTACMIVSPPALPANLTILGNSSDDACTIVGIPTTPQLATVYTVMATNEGGSSAPVTVTITIVAASGSLIPPSNFAAAATQGSPAIAPRSWTGFADDGGQAQDQERQDQDQRPASLEASPPADADADGLIDIATTEQLHNMRYNLAGTSLKTSQSDPGNNAGC